MPQSPLLTASAAFLRDLDRQADAAVRAMLRQYEQTQRDLLAALERLQTQMQALESPTKGQLYRLDRYQALLEQVNREMGIVGNRLAGTLPGVITDATTIGVNAAGELVFLQAGYEGIKGAFTQLSVADIAQAVSFTQPGSPLMAMLQAQYGEGWASVIASQYVSGVALGWSPMKTIAALRQTLTTAAPADIARIIRTAQIYGYREVNRSAWEKSGVVESWTWSATLDNLTCGSCWAQHGTVHPVTETLDDHHNGRAEVAGNLILSSSPTAFETLRFNGDIFVIHTASGKFLAVTPNHPVLTRRGWIAAAFVKEGDDVISSSGAEWASKHMSPDKDHAPTTVENIPRAFDMQRLGRVPESAKHLYGDGGDGDVDVVYFNRLLWDGLQPAYKQHISERLFGQRYAESDSLAGFRNLATRLKALMRSPDGILRGFDTGVLLGLSHMAVSDGVGLGRSVSHDASLAQYACDRRTGNAVGFSQPQLSFTSGIAGDDFVNRQRDLIAGVGGNFSALNLKSFGFTPKQPMSLEVIRNALLASVPSVSTHLGAITRDIVFDRVIEVGVRNSSSHVYSLQTQEEWYYSNGIISHNCAALPNIKGNADYQPDNAVSETGEERFRNLSLADQEAAASGGGWGAQYRAWQDGAIKWGDMAMQTNDDVYGTMRGMASLKALLGDKASQYYG